MKNLDPKKGLSMSDAQFLSNLCNQKAEDINKIILAVGIANKDVDYKGNMKPLITTPKMPTDIVELLKEKALLHGLQAQLMDAMKRKQAMIDEIQAEEFEYDIPAPKGPELTKYPMIQVVDEQWGFDQLTQDELNEYLAQEALASHIGQYIHKKGHLTKLREDLAKSPHTEWFEINKDEKAYVEVKFHYDAEYYNKLHEELAQLHRDAEKKVNYFKAKIKNIVSDENIKRYDIYRLEYDKVAEENRLLTEAHNADVKKHIDARQIAKNEFEKKQAQKLKDVSALKIVPDPRYQDLINLLNGVTSK